MPASALAVDLGGTELRVAVVDAAGAVLAIEAEATDTRGGPAPIIAQIAALTQAARARVPRTLAGVGVACCGPLDPARGIVVAPPTLPGWHDVHLASLLQQRLGLPVVLENDANAAALGEWRFGAGRGTQSMVFVTVSTGIGGGAIIDGHLLHGRRGMAAEIGHMTIAEGGPRCACGVQGCWEALASGTALGRAAAALSASGQAPLIRTLAGDQPVTGRHVEAAARQGDDAALALLDQEARFLGIGLANLLHLYAPEMLVLGGGVMAGLDLMRNRIEETMRDRAMPAYRDVPVVAAALGPHAGLVGAASLVLG